MKLLFKIFVKKMRKRSSFERKKLVSSRTWRKLQKIKTNCFVLIVKIFVLLRNWCKIFQQQFETCCEMFDDIMQDYRFLFSEFRKKRCWIYWFFPRKTYLKKFSVRNFTILSKTKSGSFLSIRQQFIFPPKKLQWVESSVFQLNIRMSND